MRSPRYPKLSEDELSDRIVKRYTEQQWSLDDIAGHYEVSYSSVRRELLRRGIELRMRGDREVAKLRRCYRCGGDYPLKKFVKDASKPGGHGYLCKGCDSERRKRATLDDQDYRGS